MPSAFVPFLPAPGKTAPATGAGQNNDSARAANAFAAIVPGQPSAANPAACAHAGKNGAKPAVSLERDGERITLIRIQCGCGEVIELDCAY